MYRSHIGHALVCFSISILAWMSFPSCNSAGEKDTEWTAVGGSKANMHYSVLTEIDTSNVSLLAPAWTYDTGDADTVNHSQIQCNPLIIDGTLYGVTPQLKLFAVDAATGTNKWTFDPYDTAFKKNSMFFAMNNCRGIAYWTDGKGKRIFYSAGSALISVNAETGRPDSAFANQGRLDLHDGLDRDVSTLYVAASSAGMVWKDLIIIGSRVDEGADAAPGHIRAFDVRTGKRAWIFHTIPQPGEPGHESWDDPNAWQRIGGANNWSGMSLDEQRGILFVPTGSASFDFYGGKRLGNALYANCLLALDVATGKKRWHFQGIHHDMWDRDFPAPPALVTVMHEGKKVDAVAQTSKTGFIFLLDRETGKSLFPIEERPVPTDTKLIGEKASPTQPIPLKPAPLVRQHFAESELNDLVPDTSYQKIHNTWTGLRKDHLFAPPSPEGTVILPGFDGGAEWGGPAFDPQTGLLYVNTSEMAWILKMVKQPLVPEKENYPQAGQRLYFQYCMACHGYDRKGTGNYPAIDTADRKYNDSAFLGLINSGRRMMPAFKQIKDEEKKAILTFILGKKGLEKTMFPPQPVDSFRSLPYTNTGYIKFLTPEGYPAIKPPWGNLTAVNLNTGEKAWSVTLGEYPEFAAKGIQTGTENYGGPVVTAGGVLFIAATRDGKIRAYNKRTGKLLWSFDLPAPGFATPSVYSVKGRQYLVIACGGGKLGTKSGGKYMAFALPMTK
jgi:quinoprotein glucose dehydrogenase